MEKSALFFAGVIGGFIGVFGVCALFGDTPGIAVMLAIPALAAKHAFWDEKKNKRKT